jgi:hypothetical protein
MTGRQGSSVPGARWCAVSAALLCAAALCGCADSLAGMSLPSLPKIGDINPFAERGSAARQTRRRHAAGEYCRRLGFGR